MSRKPNIQIGDKFERLTVIARAENYITPKGQKHSQWLCECECGNKKIIKASELKSRHVKSCGCLAHEYNHSKVEDLTGQRFNMLTVIEQDEYYIRPSGKKDVQWKCICDCGNIKIVIAFALKNGSIKSCGCFKDKWNRPSRINDLTGQVFNDLTVIKLDKIEKGYAYWKCKCKCGNVVSVRGTKLTSGWTKSCGCVKSQGEQKIISILENNNIPYETQKTFNDLPNLRFDFYINNSYLIEYDGKQHYESSGGWNNEENFKRNLLRDIKKNEYCISNKIPLIRIPYTHFDSLCLEDLLLETSDFIYYF